MRWRGGTLTGTTLDLPRLRPAIVRTSEDTIALVRRLSTYYPDTVIAGILNRQGRTNAYGHRFDANTVGNLRRHWKIPRFRPSSEPATGELMTIRKAAAILGVAPSTIHRALNDGAIAGEQLTVGAPWRIDRTNELRARFSDEAPPDYSTMYQAMRRLGISRQTVWQRVKRGELKPSMSRADAKKACASNRYKRNPNSSVTLHKVDGSMTHDPTPPRCQRRAPDLRRRIGVATL